MRRKGKNRTTHYAPGDHNVVCDVTGFVVKRSECRYTWDGLLVWEGQFDPKQPQLDLRGRKDDIAVKDARPESDITFNTNVQASDL